MSMEIKYENYRDLDKHDIENLILEKQSTEVQDPSDDEKNIEKDDEKSVEDADVEPKKKYEKIDNSDVELTDNIFKKILFFTNTRNPKENKSLAVLLDAIKAIKKDKKLVPELFVFEVDTVGYEESNDYDIKVYDSENEVLLENDSNIDTLIFSRLSTVEYPEAVNTIQVLQDRGFLILNPIKGSKLAMDKYDTALLLSKAEIPQPNFALVTKDILYDEKAWKEVRKTIHGKDLKKNDEDNEELEYVCKILDGHGGCGVFMSTDKSIVSILQTMFEVNPDCQLLLQRKEEADGGDIRVHVLTLMNDKQLILGAMKRVKLKGDFRSNVSLGATAEKVELTKEQEELALKTAALSTLPWCAVDIMPLVKGSNKKLGDNVILEINSSPGTEGITDVLEENFMNILISNLNKPRLFDLQEKVSGWKETIYIKPTEDSEPIELLATIDTGNGSSTSHFEVNKYEIKGDNVEFKLLDKTYTCPYKGSMTANVGKKDYDREVIEIFELRMGPRCLHNVDISIVVDRDKNTNALINRDDLSGMSYVVNPAKTHILTAEIDKVQILPE